MNQDPILLKDINHLLSRLKENENRLQEIRRSASETFSSVKKARAETLQKLTSDALPDLNEETLRQLQRQIPELITNAVRKEINGARNVHVPFTVLISGGASQYRADATRKVRDALRIKLAAMIDSTEKKLAIWKAALADDDDAIAKIQRKLAALDDEENEMREKKEKLLRIKKAHEASGKSPPQAIVETIAKLAKEDRVNMAKKGPTRVQKVREPAFRSGYRSGNRSNYDDDFDFFSDLIIPYLILSQIFSGPNYDDYMQESDVYENSSSSLGQEDASAELADRGALS
ncbi:MAG TPA: hypothetical protein VJB70_00330 [Candidatus Paceibacterota bacterium]